MEYRICESNIERLDRKMEKLRRKLEKLNASLTYEKVREEFENFGDEENPDIRKFIIVNVEGKAQINGWQVIGKLEAASNNENVVTAFDANYVNVLDQFRTVKIKCEHCNTRAYRKYSYILFNESTKETKQVGSACLSNFTGVSANRYAAFLSCFDELVEFEEIPQGLTFKKYYKTNDILQIAIQLINKYGYTAKTTYDEWSEIYNPDATSIAVHNIVTGQKLHERYARFRFEKNDPETLKAVDELKAFFDNLTPQNNYESNVKLAIKNECVDSSKIGILAASIQTKRIKEQEAKRLSELTSIHVGSIGDKLQLENCKFDKISSYSTQYGVTYVYKIICGTNTFIWKTSKLLESAENINLKGTVKSHSEFRNEKQTELTRVKII